jgi:polyphenol oxidase
MITHPFKILQPFQDEIDVMLLIREDDVKDDEGTAEALDADYLASLIQKHGNKVVYVEDETMGEEEGDGMVTNVENLTLAVRSADCQTFVAYAPSAGACGVLHAGWKGLLADAMPSFLSSLSRAFRVSPSELLIGAGPSLCTKCAEFTDPVAELKGIDPKFFHGRCADLRGIAEDQLFSLGVKPEHFERHPGCTRCEPNTYWSYRADKEKVLEGYRNVLAIRLKEQAESETKIAQ